MNIAVFADLHGRILLAFKLCARWQRETGERITAILQAGDLGAYPDESRLDRATMRHAERDPNELGYLRDFTQPLEDVAASLAETACPMIFVRGNHEDHFWLDILERQAPEALFPIDPYQRIYCLKTGAPSILKDDLKDDGAGDDAALHLLGIGRVGSPPGSNKSHRPRYAQPYELERLYALERPQVDVLLTHDVPPTYLNDRSRGMNAIRDALDSFKPIYHFFGHTDEPYQRFADRNGVTTSIRMADLNWERGTHGAQLEPAVMGLLRWRSRHDHAFEVVDAPWLREYTANAWRWR